MYRNTQTASSTLTGSTIGASGPILHLPLKEKDQHRRCFYGCLIMQWERKNADYNWNYKVSGVPPQLNTSNDLYTPNKVSNQRKHFISHDKGWEIENPSKKGRGKKQGWIPADLASSVAHRRRRPPTMKMVTAFAKVKKCIERGCSPSMAVTVKLPTS